MFPISDNNSGLKGVKSVLDFNWSSVLDQFPSTVASLKLLNYALNVVIVFSIIDIFHSISTRRVAQWLMTCAQKAKVSGLCATASYMQR